jgi:hypothetical protein
MWLTVGFIYFFREQDIKSSGFIKVGVFLDHLSDYQRLNNDSFPCSFVSLLFKIHNLVFAVLLACSSRLASDQEGEGWILQYMRHVEGGPLKPHYETVTDRIVLMFSGVFWNCAHSLQVRRVICNSYLVCSTCQSTDEQLVATCNQQILFRVSRWTFTAPKKIQINVVHSSIEGRIYGHIGTKSFIF